MKKMILCAVCVVLFGPFGAEALGQGWVPKIEAGNLYVYAIGTDDKLYRIKKTNGKWGSLQLIDSGVAGVDACSPNPGKTVIMTRDAGNRIGVYVEDSPGGNGGLYMYESKIGSDPSVACQPGDKINLFVRGHNNKELYANFSENGVWANQFELTPTGAIAIEDVASVAKKQSKKSFWEYLPGAQGEEFPASMLGASGLGGQMKGGPEGVAFGGNNRAVFVRGMDDQVWWRVTFDGKPWEQFQPLGGMKVTSDPTAVSRKPGEILLFARGEDNRLYVRQYLNGNWNAWIPWGGVVAGSPDATSWGGDRVDVFYRGPDGSLVHAWLDSPAYAKEPQVEKVPGVVIKGDPTAVGAKW